MENFIEVKNLTKSYKTGNIIVPVVNDVSFNIKKGEFAVILGASGAGKSTVLNMLGGIDKCNSGEIIVDGEVITNMSDNKLMKYRRKDIGFVFQFYNLIPNLTALENVELNIRLTKSSENAEKILQSTGLGERINNFPSQMSGGEQQRVSIARALAKKPKLLLCDEPTGALDFETGKLILKLLYERCKSTGTTVVLITHNSTIATIADRVITMRSGKIISNIEQTQPASIDTIEW